MLFNALKIIQGAFQAYISEVEEPPPPAELMVLDNIAMAEDLGGNRENLDGKIVMSLVNIQEETTLKNIPNYRQENGRTVYKNSPVHLNLFVLFSVLHREQYETSLKRLSRVVEFFQWRKEFSFSTTPQSGVIVQDIKVYADLYSLTFEQLNHLWGALGGKQVPFVLYKLRVVALEAQKQQGEGPAITEILVNE
ncbi:MAG: DUF4255 domain-containing protein [Leptolyngbya sp. SIO4C1]|nr:DUF4255 domain-containing protein [Leptolyngbya sp. SIO4C1]